MSLMERLGGESKIDKIVDTIYDMIMEIPELENYFSNCRLDEQKLMFKMFVTFVAKKYPKTEAVYKGMKEAHEKLHITNAHFDLMLSLIGKSIKTVCNCSNTIDEFLEISQGYRPLIVFESVNGDTEKSADSKYANAISQDSCSQTQPQKQSEINGLCPINANADITHNDIKELMSGNQRRNETTALTLFDRIGGLQKITAMTDKLYQYILDDSILGPYFTSVPIAKQKKMFSLFVTLITKQSWLTAVGTANMQAAHSKLTINSEDFQRMLTLMSYSLFSIGTNQNHIDEFLILAQNYKHLIVTSSNNISK
ncbi:globin-like protein [Globomyces pollinis-pini]|nr:globin-like protein [Globomyces pollinis-pini]